MILQPFFLLKNNSPFHMIAQSTDGYVKNIQFHEIILSFFKIHSSLLLVIQWIRYLFSFCYLHFSLKNHVTKFPRYSNGGKSIKESFLMRFFLSRMCCHINNSVFFEFIIKSLITTVTKTATKTVTKAVWILQFF